MNLMITDRARNFRAKGGVVVRRGFVEVESDKGIIYVRPDEVAYICEAPSS
jgi:hypothetical protein